eukprot:UN16544
MSICKTIVDEGRLHAFASRPLKFSVQVRFWLIIHGAGSSLHDDVGHSKSSVLVGSSGWVGSSG